MSGGPAIGACPSCGTEIAPGLLACPGCRRLVHAAQLSALVEEASAAQNAGDLSLSLQRWRAALELLPPETNQAALIRSQIEVLGRQLDQSGAAPPAGASAGGRSSAGKAAAGLGLLGMLLTKGKLLLLGLTKASTFFSMFASFAVYWSIWGWPFALGVVVSIYIHEMGHVDALRRYGIKATAPMFIPGIGAMVRLQQYPANPVEDARIGLAGPLWGMAAALASYLVFLASGVKVWEAIAHMGAWINIFNLIPIAPLDGGRGFRGLSRNQAMLVTMAFGCAWYLTEDGLYLLLAVVGLWNTATKPRDAKGDRIAFIQFLLLIALLSALVYLCPK
jgi:Zn-dependent protease